MKTWPMACPKCLGDLREETTIYDSYVTCINCRYTLTHHERDALLAARKPSEAPSQPTKL